MKKYPFIGSVLAAVTILPLAAPAFAAQSEAQAYCDLQRSQAAVRSKVLGSAEGFATLAPVDGGKKALMAGVRQSVAGMRQAGLVVDIADADCQAYAATKEVSSALANIEGAIELQAQTARKAALTTALDKAEANLVFEQKALAAQTATWADMRAALDQRDRIAQALAQTEQVLAHLSSVPVSSKTNLRPSLEKGVAAQSRMAELRSRLDASAGWDVKVEAGMKRDLGTDSQTPYVGFAITRSFGASSAAAGASEVATKAAAYLQARDDGATQLFSRKQSEMRGIYNSQGTALVALKQRQALLSQALDQIKAVSTSPALRVARNLGVEMLEVGAERQALEVKQKMLADWLAEQEGGLK